MEIIDEKSSQWEIIINIQLKKTQKHPPKNTLKWAFYIFFCEIFSKMY